MISGVTAWGEQNVASNWIEFCGSFLDVLHNDLSKRGDANPP